MKQQHNYFDFNSFLHWSLSSFLFPFPFYMYSTQWNNKIITYELYEQIGKIRLEQKRIGTWTSLVSIINYDNEERNFAPKFSRETQMNSKSGLLLFPSLVISWHNFVFFLILTLTLPPNSLWPPTSTLYSIPTSSPLFLLPPPSSRLPHRPASLLPPPYSLILLRQP